jgi:hypothetical protein
MIWLVAEKRRYSITFAPVTGTLSSSVAEMTLLTRIEILNINAMCVVQPNHRSHPSHRMSLQRNKKTTTKVPCSAGKYQLSPDS